MQKFWIITSPLLYLNFKSFAEPNSSSLIRFQCIVHVPGVLFSESWDFYKLKMGDLICGGNQFCRKSELFVAVFCFWILKVVCTQIRCHSLDFNGLVMIQEYFSQSLELSTYSRGGPNFWGNQFCWKYELFCPSFCISIFKVLRSQILCH